MRPIVPVPAWDDVIVPEDGDLVNRADLVAAYQALANRDEFASGSLQTFRTRFNSIGFAAFMMQTSSSTSTLTLTKLTDRTGGFSVDGSNSIVIPASSLPDGSLFQVQATLSGVFSTGTQGLFSAEPSGAGTYSVQVAASVYDGPAGKTMSATLTGVFDGATHIRFNWIGPQLTPTSGLSYATITEIPKGPL